MADRIDSVQNGITPKPARDTSGTRETATVRQSGHDGSASAAATSVPADTIVLTEQGQRLAELEKALGDLPAVDAARVEAVKADIASGNYKIDVERIADALLRTEADFDE